MRSLRLLIPTVAAVALIGMPVSAFHDAGVAHCNGCHTMHNSQDGLPIDDDGNNPYLLVDDTASDVCLGCHALGAGAVWGLDPEAPPNELGGGNFAFLDEDNLNDGHSGGDPGNEILGDAAGHNVVAVGWGPGADSTHLTFGPGGNFPASALGCTSCHDPHGNADFRLLYGVATVQDGLFAFTNPAPTAVGIGLRAGPEANDNHTAYQGGMSAWCGNCHGDFHGKNLLTDMVHPSGTAMGPGIALAYQLYNGTSDPLGGAAATSYLAAVPFEDAANTTTSTAGPTPGSQVSCITCHRAHATSAPDAGRWDFDVTFLHEDGVESGSYQIPDPYADLSQRSLCNKCHVKDANSAPFVP